MINWEISTDLTNLTHFDGRNAKKLLLLRTIFSEYAWMKLRLSVMISYCIKVLDLLKPQQLLRKDIHTIKSLVDTFDLTSAKRVKKYESTVNHDLKAIELYVIDQLENKKLRYITSYLNLGIGSEDINNIAYAVQVKRSRGEVIMPLLKNIINSLIELCGTHQDSVMVARTHGQPANMTTFGKEVASTLLRLCDEIEIFQTLNFDAKFSGEVGSYQAQYVVNQKVDWINITDGFIRSFDLRPFHGATQINPYDSIVRYLQSLLRINSILLDFVKNMWLYVLLGYLKVKKVSTEVGSAGMPHKVNPIYFEGAEGGLVMANDIIESLSRTLPINRLDRDFSDSTLRRNIVLPIALTVLSYQSIIEALKRIDIDRLAMDRDVLQHQEIWIETIKTYAITHGVYDAYDLLKKKTRGKILDIQDLTQLIELLPLTKSEKRECLSFCGKRINPYPEKIVKEAIQKAKKLQTL